MKYFLAIAIILQLFLYSCTKLRESAGVTRKSLDEFQVIENPPLVIPPDFNLLPPDQLKKKNIEDVEKELAKEILFGLEESTNLNETDQLSTMNEILESANVNDTNSDIRSEIDQQFANEVSTKSIFLNEWKDETEILNAVKESERIRNKLVTGESIAEEEILEETEEKTKKKKRFFFF
ncbi:MAG: hypothetical protein CMP16_01385 [Rickettsiales bacterium]|nr:hypothetical protein [Rickettsiales bacterium]|tara:strand:+ start:6054 stop:6590 length:537 start_codon:yes stop_codon:yes gene_type:complete